MFRSILSLDTHLKILRHSLSLLALSVLFLQGSNAFSAIVGINTPVTSSAMIIFDDTNSSTPPAGVTLTGPSVSPWSGTTVTLVGTTDPNTSDFATGSLDATFIPSSNTYAINFTGITLTQAAGNTGYADLDFIFNVEYQLDAAGLPAQPTLYPNFVVNGTVQNTSGSFAAVNGAINYYGVNTAGTISLVETVNYNSVWNTPGSFTGTAVGIPVSGTTPLLVGNTTLIIDGFIHFRVDPATINAESIQSTPPAPEPATLTISLLGLLAIRKVRLTRKHSKPSGLAGSTG